jgi:hypothetical protein
MNHMVESAVLLFPFLHSQWELIVRSHIGRTLDSILKRVGRHSHYGVHLDALVRPVYSVQYTPARYKQM